MKLGRGQLILFGAIGLIVLAVLLVITGVLPGLESPLVGGARELEIHGFADEPGIWETIGREYKSSGQNVNLNYVKKDPETYEAELLNALASGQGPDIFLLKDSWLEKHRAKLTSLADGSQGYQKKNVKSVFADGVAKAITDEAGALLGTPLALDTLALFFNHDYFNSANIPSPPQTWEEVAQHAKALTKFSEVGGIRRAGIALGTAENVEHGADILTALIYQSGGDIIDAKNKKSALAGPAAISALTFYTSFANPTKKTYSWNALFDNSLRAFAAGEAAMAVGYASDVKKIMALNPKLNFDTAPLPQITLNTALVNYGRFNVWVVSRLSPEPEVAWEFLLWLQEKSIQKTYIDAVGLPPARRDLVGTKPPREYLSAFYDQVLSARTFPPRATDSLSRILGDTIEAVESGKFSVERALERADNEINALLNRP